MHYSKDTNAKVGTYFVLVAFILGISSGLSTLVGWFNSVDVKGWWPLSLAFQIGVGCIYAAVFAATMKFSRTTSLKFVVIYNSILGLVLFLFYYLFYRIETDWLAINTGAKKLNLLQKILFSDLTYWTIYLLFLLGAFVVCYATRKPRD